MPIRRIIRAWNVRAWKYFVLSLLVVLLTIAVGPSHPGLQPLVSQAQPAGPGAIVAPLPNPTLPDWISQISPTGAVDPLAQIRIQFKNPLIPLEALGSPAQQELLKKFEITPNLPGRFRFLTPRMVGFQADRALPKATRIKVTLKAGLADLNNHQLTQEIAWTFNTEAIRLTDLPTLPSDPDAFIEPLGLEPTLEITSNVELDLNSVNVKLIAENSGSIVPVKIALKSDQSSRNRFDRFSDPQEDFNPAAKAWIYTLTPQNRLNKATRYRLEFAPGMRPKEGNLVSETAFIGSLMTYSPLQFQGFARVNLPDASGAYGRFVTGNAQLKFNNGLLAESARSAIAIDPAPKPNTRWLQVYDDDRVINLNPWALEPHKKYRITIAATLKDQFGQTLDKPVTVDYETGEVAADFWAPSGLNIFPTSKNLQLNLSAINLPKPEYKAAYRVVQPTDLVYYNSAEAQENQPGLLADSKTWQPIVLPAAQPNTSQTIPIPIQDKLGGSTGMLAYGVQARTYQYEEDGRKQWRDPTYSGLVQLTNLGVFSQWFPDSGLVRVHHLSDGSAVKNAKVAVYRSRLAAKSRPAPTPCANGTTDQTGLVQFNAADLQACMSTGATVFADAPELLTIVREDKDWAFSRSQEWSGSYGYGIYAGWSGSQPESRGTIFSDRQLYQPGETAWFTGAAYYLKAGQLKQDKNTRYTLTLKDPNDKATDLGTQTTNEFGTFSIEVPIAKTQPLGIYTIEAKNRNGVEILGTFRVAEFKPPNFKVDLALDHEMARAGDTIKAQVQSNYLFGAPVEGGQVDYYATREKVDFIPKGWEDWNFGRQWFWPEEEPSVESDVLQTQAALDPKGQGQQSFTIAPDLPYPMAYRLDAQVKDVSNLAVANSKTVIALPSDRLIGLKGSFVADAGKPFELQVVVTDAKGGVVAGQAVKLELQQIIYSNVTQVIEGSRRGRNQVEYKTVGQREVRSGDQAQTVSLTPPESGSYRIRANFANAKDEITATDLQIWATGERSVFWGSRYRNNRLELKLDKKTYQPGETANVVIQSPYPEADLYFAVIRHKTLYKIITKVKGGAPQIQFKVTPEMLPNAAIEAVLVRQGEPLEKLQPGSLDNLVHIGFAPFKTSLDQQYLKLQIQPEQPTIAPGGEANVQFTLQNAKGKPTQGQLTVMVVNEAVLQLTGYRPPDLVKTVYAEQAISTRFADNRPDVVLEPLASPIDKGWGFGGGLSNGSGDTRIRKEFKPIAYYNGSLITDSNGKASIRFKVPDDLTTWRVLAVATDGAMHFGNQDATLMATQPLVTNPLLPQFARVGDRFAAGIAVTNNTGKPGSFSSQGSFTGALQPLNNQATTVQDTLESATKAYRFPIVATRPGNGTMQFQSMLNGKTDAFELPLLVKPLEMTEQVVETGATEQRAAIPLQIDGNVAPNVGGLEIALASTLIPELKEPARQALEDREFPLLEPAASQLSIAASLQVLSKTYGQSFEAFNPPNHAAQALERLTKLQRSDGGFATFPGDATSDPFVSPYVAEALGQAIEAKLPVNAEMISRLQGYLQKTLTNPGQYQFCSGQRCKDQVRLRALIGLAALGEKRKDFLGDLYDRREQFDLIDRIKLARYLSQFPDWQTESKTLATKIQETVYETGRSAAVNLPRRWWWFSSPTTAQAEATRLFITRKASPELLNKLVSSLLVLRRQGTWGCTYYNAQALTALVDYSQLLPTPPNFTATAALNNQTLLAHKFQGYETPSVDRTIPMAELPRGRQTVQLEKSGTGTLHYLAAYRYRPQGNPPGRFNGLSVLRSIHPANQSTTIGTMGLAATEQPLVVNSGQVFDIELQITTDHPIDHVVITDPLPAGFEAVDTEFRTSTPYFAAQSDSWQINYQTIYRDRIMAYGSHFEAGVYTLHYLARSVTPGTFTYPGSEVHLQYAPEEFGRSATATLQIQGS